MSWVIAMFLFRSMLCSLGLWTQKLSLQQSHFSKTIVPLGVDIFVNVCQSVTNQFGLKSTFFSFDFHLVFSINSSKDKDL